MGVVGAEWFGVFLLDTRWAVEDLGFGLMGVA